MKRPLDQKLLPILSNYLYSQICLSKMKIPLDEDLIPILIKYLYSQICLSNFKSGPLS